MVSATRKQIGDDLKKGSDADVASDEPVENAEGSTKATVKDEPTPPATAPKKSLGAKEVVPFEWKLVGESQGMILTLFKAVDRTEVETQLERVAKEGYYTNLRIMEANAPIKQPKPPQVETKPTETPKQKRGAPASTRGARTPAKAPAAPRRTRKKAEELKKTGAAKRKSSSGKIAKKNAARKSTPTKLPRKTRTRKQ